MSCSAHPNSIGAANLQTTTYALVARFAAHVAVHKKLQLGTLLPEKLQTPLAIAVIMCCLMLQVLKNLGLTLALRSCCTDQAPLAGAPYDNCKFPLWAPMVGAFLRLCFPVPARSRRPESAMACRLARLVLASRRRDTGRTGRRSEASVVRVQGRRGSGGI
jgi:hypothetical protein